MMARMMRVFATLVLAGGALVATGAGSAQAVTEDQSVAALKASDAKISAGQQVRKFDVAAAAAAYPAECLMHGTPAYTTHRRWA